jgi:hypothetical protein
MKKYVMILLLVSSSLSQISNITYKDSIYTYKTSFTYHYYLQIDSTIKCDQNNCYWSYDTIGLDSSIDSSITTFYHKVRVMFTLYYQFNDSFKIVSEISNTGGAAGHSWNVKIPIDSMSGDTITRPGVNKIIFIYYHEIGTRLNSLSLNAINLNEINAIINNRYHLNTLVKNQENILYSLNGRIINHKTGSHFKFYIVNNKIKIITK